MAKGQECIRFETLKSRLENIQQKPLEQHKTDRIHGVTWWVLDLMIPGARSPIPGFVPDLIQGGRGRAGCRPGRASATYSMGVGESSGALRLESGRCAHASLEIHAWPR